MMIGRFLFSNLMWSKNRPAWFVQDWSCHLIDMICFFSVVVVRAFRFCSSWWENGCVIPFLNKSIRSNGTVGAGKVREFLGRRFWSKPMTIIFNLTKCIDVSFPFYVSPTLFWEGCEGVNHRFRNIVKESLDIHTPCCCTAYPSYPLGRRW
jgi:hypothetical protein